MEDFRDIFEAVLTAVGINGRARTQQVPTNIAHGTVVVVQTVLHLMSNTIRRKRPIGMANGQVIVHGRETGT